MFRGYLVANFMATTTIAKNAFGRLKNPGGMVDSIAPYNGCRNKLVKRRTR